MNDADRSFVIRVVAVLGASILIAVVVGHFVARFMGLPVDIEKFYNFLGPPFSMIINALIIAFSTGRKNEPAPSNNPEEKQ